MIFIYLYIFLCLLLLIIVIILLSRKDQYKYLPIDNVPIYKGLCLFDIDGTLTTGIDNEKTVDLCLKAGYAVGISTAGAGYTLNNLLSFPWMPYNLYKFMEKNNFNTFNNVANNILSGIYDPDDYSRAKARVKQIGLSSGIHSMDFSLWGVLKGHSLVHTANLYNITDPRHMILFDNDPDYLHGLKRYHPDLVGICAGAPCGKNVLSPALLDPYYQSLA